MGGPSLSEKLRDSFYRKVDPIFTRYLNSVDALRRFAFTILVLIFIGTVALSVISPFKLFPRHKSLAELRRIKLDSAIKKASFWYTCR